MYSTVCEEVTPVCVVLSLLQFKMNVMFGLADNTCLCQLLFLLCPILPHIISIPLTD